MRSVISLTSMKSACRWRVARDVAAAAQEREPGRLFHRRVDARELDVEQLVVVAELEQLRVGELEDLERRLDARLGVVDKRRVPRRHDEVVGQVGQAVAA